ncbi:hypothetical protein [Nitrosomonas communis]|uniref:Uncharacterized protein n=1 Tax=Nitrosomonas communis TaxID=44574 RepID=A0A1H2X2V0_9PROT|nr:hypothetical protein [Nitrosomonas communis]SDW86599.1 hypothetical protein SAMN05421882_103332 [Nitrosomonas communis]
MARPLRIEFAGALYRVTQQLWFIHRICGCNKFVMMKAKLIQFYKK